MSILASILVVMRNDDLLLTVTFTTVTGAIVNITGSTCFFTVKVANTDTDVNAKISKTWNVHSDPVDGITTFSLVPADTATLLGKYFYDIQIKTAGGLIYTPIHGIFRVIADTTLRIV